MYRIIALESSHLSLPWFHLLSKGNHTHPRFNCIYILPMFTSPYKCSYLLFLYYSFILFSAHHFYHITLLYSRPGICRVSDTCRTQDECPQREYYVRRCILTSSICLRIIIVCLSFSDFSNYATVFFNFKI